MDLKEKLRGFISEKSYVPKKADELYESFSSEIDRAGFSEAVKELIADGYIAYGKKGKLMSTEAAGYMKGTFRSNAKGFGFFMPDEEYRPRAGGDLYIASENTAGAVNDDYVLALMTAEARPGDNRGGEGRIVKILEHRMTTVVGTLRELAAVKKRGAPRYYIKPDDRRISFLLEIDDPAAAKPGYKVEAEITVYPTATESAKGRITGVFGESESTEANYAAILHEYDISASFSPDVIAEAEKAALKPLDASGRLDLRGKCILTIDSETAKDLDDAVSVEKTADGYRLGVHIADVSEYVRDKTALNDEAFKRGTSVYFTDKVVPMLPECISNGCCSLNAGTDKYALSALIELDSQGEIAGCELKESIIRTVVRGVYSELNDVGEKGRDSAYWDKYKPVEEMLPVMLELYHVLDEKSRRNGALELETNEAKIILENGRPVDIVKEERGDMEKLIEQFMLCANEAVANWLYWQDMPCVYRIHEEPSSEKMQTFSLFAYNLGLNVTPLKAKNLHSTALENVLEQAKEAGIGTTVSYMLLRSLMKAKYSSVCSPHFGLAIDKYCHFTSPIRRYPDLSVHRIVKAVLHGEISGEKLKYYSDFAAKSAEQSSENEIRAVSAERAIDDLYKTIYMSDRLGEVYPGIVSSVTSFGLFVELENTCEGLVPISTLDGYFEYDERNMTLSCGYTVYKLGKKVNVRIENADIISRRVDMSIAPDDE